MNKLMSVIVALVVSASSYVMAADGLIGTPAEGSKFSQISIGMHSKEVTDLIGYPTDQKMYSTGKAFIPFHAGGNDNTRAEYRYKGEGVLTFSVVRGSLKLIRITVDPGESGYIRD